MAIQTSIQRAGLAAIFRFVSMSFDYKECKNTITSNVKQREKTRHNTVALNFSRKIR